MILSAALAEFAAVLHCTTVHLLETPRLLPAMDLYLVDESSLAALQNLSLLALLLLCAVVPPGRHLSAVSPTNLTTARCPKGHFREGFAALNSSAALRCSRCAAGSTTQGTGSTSTEQCSGEQGAPDELNGVVSVRGIECCDCVLQLSCWEVCVLTFHGSIAASQAFVHWPAAAAINVVDGCPTFILPRPLLLPLRLLLLLQCCCQGSSGCYAGGSRKEWQHRHHSPPVMYQPLTRHKCSRCLRHAPPAITVLVACLMASAAASHAALKGCGHRAWALPSSPSAVSACKLRLLRMCV
jgi:hypothetical protein